MSLFMSKALISVVIPTKNSAKTLNMCLRSIKGQSYQNTEIIVVDGYSSDGTVEIAKKYRCKVLFEKSLLGARAKGIEEAQGEYILLLDSDQILMPTCMERAINMLERGYDALILEESSYEAKTFIQKLYEIDRMLVHSTLDVHSLHGVLLARFFKKSILERTLNNIPLKLLSEVIVYDHALINYEASKLTTRIGFLRDAIKHIEPKSFKQVILKFYRWGKTARNLTDGPYEEILKRKTIPRKGILHPLKIHYSIASLLLWFLHAVPFAIGYLTTNKRKPRDY
ncbi:MAG: hypothetical protein C4294_18210 [Nitrospiraceae bacterium]